MPKKSSSKSRSKKKSDLPQDAEGPDLTIKYRDISRRNKPKFKRGESTRYGRIKASWRHPKGIDNKSRQKIKGYRIQVNVGYRNPKIIRGLHPSGLQDILVHNPKDLEDLDPDTQGVRIAHAVGMRKRISIQNKADELGLIVFNPPKLSYLGEPITDVIDEDLPDEEDEKDKK